MKRFVTGFDSGASSNIISLGELLHRMREKIEPLDNDINVRKTSNKSVSVIRSINLFVNIGTNTEHVRFYVVDKLATSVILGCHYCDIHVDTIRPRFKIV